MDRKIYLDRLYQWLAYKVEKGLLSSDAADQIYSSTENYLVSKRIKKIDNNYKDKLPYFGDIVVGDWKWTETWTKAVSDIQSDQQKAMVQKYDTETAKNQYLPQLKSYLEGANVSPAVADATSKMAEQLIEQGVPIQNLPNFEAVREFTQYKAGEKRAIQMQPLQKEEARKQAEETRAKADALYNLAVSESQREVAQGILGRRGALREGARQYEQARQEALPQLNAPMDWIQKWQMEHALSPYGGRDISPYGYLTERVMERGIPQPGIPSIVREFAPGVAPTYSGFMGRPQYEQAIKEPLTKVPITTPSGQALGRMLPSEIEALQGYAQYSGQYWPDILTRTARMLPQPLRGSRWRGARQGG